MLKNLGTVPLWLKFGSRICVFLRNDRLDDELRDRIRPLVFAGMACWFDKV